MTAEFAALSTNVKSMRTPFVTMALGLAFVAVDLWSTVAVGSTAAADIPGPTASEVLANVDAAVGGQSVKTQISTLSTVIDGKYATVTIMMKRPDRFLQRIRFPQSGAALTIGVVGSSAWIQMPDGQVRSADLGDKDAGLAVVSTLFSPASWKHVTRKPDRDYLAGTYYVLHIVGEAGRAMDMLIDKKTYEPIASQITIKGATYTEEYTDFTQGPGRELYPRHIKMHAPGGATIREDTITSLDDNVPIDDGAFEPPDR